MRNLFRSLRKRGSLVILAALLAIFITIIFMSSIVLASPLDDTLPSAANNIDSGAVEINEQLPLIIYHFYGQGCPHCARMKMFLDDMEEEFPTLETRRFEIYQDANNRDEYFALAAAYGLEVDKMPVPITFIGDKSFAGFTDKTEVEVREQIEYCLSHECITKEPKTGTTLEVVTIPAVIAAAAVDAINPCAFAVLIILLTTILAAGSRKKALFAGLAFSLSIFISYFLMGIGLYSALQISGLTNIFYSVVAGLAIIIGLFNLKDYLWYGKWFKMEVPMAWRPKMKMLLKSVTSIPGAFLIGVLISLFLLPCTSGPYIIILGLLSKSVTRGSAIPLLVLYNLVFILPMVLITLAIYFGITTTAKAEEWRKRKLRVLHLAAGIIILLLGIFMILSLYLNWI